MRPARLVTYCFLYEGVVLLVSAVAAYGLQFGIGSVSSYGIAVVVSFVGLYRRYGPDEAEERPTEYGLFTTAMVGIAVLLTVIVVAQLLVT